MRIVVISDVHEQWKDLVIPECDLLISAGDYSYRGEKHIVESFHKWLSVQPAIQIISLQGNHEIWVSKNFKAAKEIVHHISPKIKFVEDDSFFIDGLKFYCSSITPKFGPWAYGYDKNQLKEHWSFIPEDTQVLVTHGPSYGVLDCVAGRILGDPYLRLAIAELRSIKLHVFGHIHDSSGIVEIDGVTYINAAICNEEYKPVNPIRVFDLKE